MSNSKNAQNIHTGPKNGTYPETRCHSRIKKIKCKHVWTIFDIESITEDVEKTFKLRSQLLSGAKNTKWYFELEIDADEYGDSVYLKFQADAHYDYNWNGLRAVDLNTVLLNPENEKITHRKRNSYMLQTADENKSYELGYFKEEDLLPNKITLFERNKLTIDFKITFYIQEDVMEDYLQSSNISSEPIEPNLEYFESLFNNQKFSDIKIHVNGKEYSAHKCVLALRSPVFAALLEHDMMETQTNRIDVKDIEDDVFIELLRFIYTGKIENLETLAFELLPAADKYQLEKLKYMCGKVLWKNMSVENGMKILLLAEMYGVDDLKKHAINFIRTHSVDFVSQLDSEAWAELMSQPELGKELLLSCLK